LIFDSIFFSFFGEDDPLLSLIEISSVSFDSLKRSSSKILTFLNEFFFSFSSGRDSS